MEKFLQNKHAENYIGIDDDMSDDFDNWIAELEHEEWIKLADEFGDLIALKESKK